MKNEKVQLLNNREVVINNNLLPEGSNLIKKPFYIHKIIPVHSVLPLAGDKLRKGVSE